MKKKNKIITLLGSLALSLLLGLFATNIYAATDSNLTLGAPNWTNDNQFQLSNLAINTEKTIKTVIVSMTEGSLDSKTSFDQGTMNKNLNGDMYTFTYTNKQNSQEVQKYLRNLTFNYEEGQQISIMLDGNETNIPSNATITNGTNGHYYMYVPYPDNFDPVTNKDKMDWIVAYNSAKDFRYLGMKGYLATITSYSEDALLRKISDKGAWSGGTRVTTPTNQRLQDLDKIKISMLAPTTQPTSQDDAKASFYWTCGPEKGQSISNYYTNWNSGEPNFAYIQGENEYESYLQINFGASQKWNDLCRTYTNKNVFGYFVEFGGYEVDPGYSDHSYDGPAVATGTVTVQSYSVNSTNKYSTSATVTNLPTTIKVNKELSFNVKTNSGWSIDKNTISIKVGGQILNSNNFSYDPATGKVIIKGEYINADVEVTVNPELDWHTTNASVLSNYLSATSISKDDSEALNSLNEEWMSLKTNTDALNYVAEKEGKSIAEIGKKLIDLSEAATFKTDHEDKLKAYTTIKPDTEMANYKAAKTAYDALPSDDSRGYAGDLKTILDNVGNAKTYVDTYADLYNAETVTVDDFDKLKEAVEAYDKLANDETKALAKDVYDNLKLKYEAATMLNDHDAIIKKTAITSADYDDIFDAITDYKALGEAKQKLIDPDGSLNNQLKAKLKASTWYEDYNVDSCLSRPDTDLSSDDLANLVEANSNLNNDKNDDIKPFISDDVKARLASAAAAKEWNDKNQDLIEKTTVTADDFEDIQSALTAYKNLDDVSKRLIDPAIIKNLEDKEATSTMLKDNPILKTDMDKLTHENLADLKTAVEAFDKLSEAQKALVDDDTKVKIEAARAALGWLDNHDAIINVETVAATDLEAIDNALQAFNDLDDNSKKLVDPAIIKNLEDKKVTSTMLKDNPVLDKEMADLTYEDLDDLKTAVEAFDALSEDQKALVDDDTKVKIETARAALGWLDNHDAIINAETVAATDLEAIDNALQAFNDLDDNSKKLVDPAIIKNLEDKKVTSTMLKDNPVLDKEMADLTYEDLDDLKTAVEAFDALSEDQKALVDDDTKVKIEAARDALTWLTNNDEIINQDIVGKADLDKINEALSAYENMSDEAKGLVDESIVNDLLAKKNAAEWADQYDEILTKDPTEITANDLTDLREALDAYNKLSDEEKALVDVDVVKSLIDAQRDAFIKKYLTDKDGNIYSVVNADNYEQILSGQTDWNNMSQAEKDAINVVLKDKIGKTYEELIAQAKELQDSAKGFVDKYLTGKDGAIYKDATEDNYKQILSGLTDWNKMSQDQKDAINAMLVANGGKTYEELLKSAQEIEKRLSVDTSDNTSIGMVYTLLASGIAGAYIILKRKKENI